jgi:hypothetical protein
MTTAKGDPSVHGVAASDGARTPKAIVNVPAAQFEALKAENERLAKQLVDTSVHADGVNAEVDRLSSLLVVERAIFESELALITRELEALRRTKVLRYTAGLRQAYAKARSVLHPFLRHR